MKKLLVYAAAVLFVISTASWKIETNADDGWVKLFDGKSLNGWKAASIPLHLPWPMGRLLYTAIALTYFMKAMCTSTTSGTSSSKPT